MSNYNSLKTAIDANIKQNGKQEITGPVLNSVLNAMVNTLGAGYQFAGIAVSDTKPGTPDAKVFYIANGKGAYTNFGGLDVTEDEVVVLYYDTEWHKVSTGIASQAKLSELQTTVGSKQDTISDLDTIRSNAAKGATALQSYTETDPVYSADKPRLALKSEIPDISGKQDKISDLDDIREGAELGKTSLQEHQDISGLATKKEVATKQDKISDLESIREGAALGKTALQSYIESDPIYTADKPNLALKSELNGKQDKLTAGDNITIVDNVISSTGGGGGSVDLSAYAKTEDVNAGLATKQDKISDLATIREGAAKGATALQSYTETDPVYMADKPSLALKTEIPDISGKVDKSELSSVATSGSYDDLINKPIIPSKTSELTNDSGYLNSIPSEYVTETELNSKGYLTEHQDISGKADKATTLAGYGITDAYTKEEVESRIASKQDLVDYVNHNSTDTGSAESHLSLIPNVLHQWTDAVSQLYLSLATPSNVTVDEFMIQFTASGSGCTLSLPDTVSWLGGAVPTITAGKTYQLSIINNLAVIGEF